MNIASGFRAMLWVATTWMSGWAVAAQAAAPPPGAVPAGGGGGGIMLGAPNLPPNLFTSPHAIAKTQLRHEWVYLPMGGNGALRTLLVHPAQEGTVPAVLLMHYDAGLDASQQGMADQLAKQGFLVVAPDLLSGMGPEGANYDSFAFPDAAIRALGKLDAMEAIRRYKVAYDYAKKLPYVNGKVASLGVGKGGEDSFRFAAEVPELSAAVVFYGAAPREAAMAKIRAPVLGLYAGDDPEITGTVEATSAAMKKLGKSYEAHVYPGATHFFLSYVVEAKNSEAVTQSWATASAFLKANTKN